MTKPFQPFEPHGAGGPRIGEIPLRLLVPNFVTVLAICAGLSGIRLAFEGRFEIAVIMVLIAAFLDGIDGRLARALKATSKFGVQMDSLADIVNFGVAPALVLYFYLLHFAKPLGWIAALIYAVACCLRLARFNVMAADPNRPAWQSEYFVGVPAPAGAVLVMLPIYLALIGLEQSKPLAYAGAAYVVLIAFLLVSRLPVYSGKKLRMSRHTVLPWLLLAVMFVMFLAIYTWETLAILAILYLLWLPVSSKWYSRRAKVEQVEANEVVPASE